MQKSRKQLKRCGMIMLAVILMSSLMPFPAFGEQPTEPPPISSNGETKRYSDSEIDLLIDDISVIALEAIERAAAEAAKAAALATVEREAVALREASQQQAEAERWRLEAEANLLAMKAAKRNGVKNTVLGVVIGILGGLAVGVGGTILISR